MRPRFKVVRLSRPSSWGADNQIYAVAQGSMIVSGFSAEGEAASVTQGVPTSGRIPDGALVEREVAGSFGKDREMIVELRDPDFTTAVRAADTINVFAKRRYGRGVAIARCQDDPPVTPEERACRPFSCRA